jgi:hypothetical protein
MALSAQFVADFSSFNDAVAGATTKLITFEDDAAKVATALGRMENAYSGKAMIQNAIEAVAAVERLGGASVLTADELTKVGNQAAQAAEKMRAMGIDVPEKLQQYADAAKDADDKTKSLSVSVTDMVKAYISAEAILEGIKAAWAAFTEEIAASIGAAAEAEKTHAKLIAALQTQGTNMPSVIAAYEAYATALQKTTIYQDDAIEGAEALLVQIGGVMPKDMERALEATTNLASGLGIDLNQAAMMVAKAAEGNTTALHKTGVTFDETRVQAEGFGYVLDTINDKFGGQAAAAANTYEGRLKQLANTWNNVQESIGRVITQNETVLKAIDLVNNAIDSNTGELKDNATATDLVSAAVIGAAKALGFLVEAANFAQTEFQDLRVFVDKTAQGFLDLGIAALQTGIAVADFRSHIDPSTWNPQFQASLADAKTALVGLQGTYANLTKDIAAAQGTQQDWSNKLGGLNTQIDGFVAELEKTRGKTKETTAAIDENSDAWDRNTVNQKAAAEATKKQAEELAKLTEEMKKFHDEEVGKTIKEAEKQREEQLKLTNAAILAEFDAQVKLNAAQGLDASGAIKLQSDALSVLNTKLAALHATKLTGISQAKQEQVLYDEYTKTLYDEAVAQDKVALAIGNTHAAAAAAVPAMVALGGTFQNDTADLETFNQELTKFYDQLAAQGNVGMMGPQAGVGMPGAGTGAGMGRVPKFGEGGAGDFGSGTIVELHGKEAIVPITAEASNLQFGGVPLSAPSGPTINMTINVTQPLGTPEAIARVVGDAQVQYLRGQGVRLPYGT